MLPIASAEAVAAAKKAHKEMYSALLSKREVLVSLLEEKLARYKELLLKEMVGWCLSGKNPLACSCTYATIL